jgi:hypothetical protein
MTDSTSNLNHGTSGGTMTAGDQVPGQIGGSLDFDGIDDLVNVGSAAVLDDVVLCARRRHAGAQIPDHVSAPGVLELQQQMEQAWRDACGTRTLADLIGGR